MRTFFFRVAVVKIEVRSLDELGNAVDFKLGFVNKNPWVWTSYRIDLTPKDFFFKQWSLAHTDTYLHLVAAHMIHGLGRFSSFIFNH